uniref:CSON011600 protein n=1 Tax=Culicoides sonorensis TaxID=179676 RepID=A0A336M3L9_CULSO
MKVLRWLLTLTFSVHVKSQILDKDQFQRQDEASIIVPCVLKLLSVYFKSERALKGSLAIVNLAPDPGLIALKVLYILNENPNHDLGVMVKDATKFHFSPAHVTEKAQNYFIMVDTADQLPQTIKQLFKLPTWNSLANVVILFTSIMNETILQEQTQDVLEQLFKRSMYNVNVMSQRADTVVIQTYTYFPYDSGNCATSVKNIRKIHECTNLKSDVNEEDNIVLKAFNVFRFPKIPNRLHGCPLNVSVAVQTPYVVGFEGNIESGIEIQMLKMIGQKLDLKPSYRIIDEETLNSLTTNNRTHGIYSDVLQGYSDIIVGGFHENAISRKILSASIPYYQDDLTWCVQPASFASTLFNVFVVFNTLIWSACITIIICSAIIFYINHFREQPTRNESPIYSLILSTSIMFNTNIGYMPKRVMIKLFLTVLLIFAFHFGAFYNAFLLKILTSPRYEPQISNAYMAVESGMTFYGNEDTLEHFSNKKEDVISQKIVENFQVCKKLDKCLEKIKYDKMTAVAISRHHALNSPMISPLDMFCFSTSNNIYTYSVAMLVKKQFHLLLKIENIIRGITESGLLSKWQRDSELVVVNTDSDDEGSVTRLKFEHVQGGFLLWVIGMGLAFVAFVFEWIVQILDAPHMHRHYEADYVVPCVLQLLNKYFKAEHQTSGPLAIVSLTSDPTLIERTVLVVFNESPKHEFALMTKYATRYHMPELHVTGQALNYFILVSKATQLTETLKQLSSLPTWNPLANFVILFTKVLNETYLEDQTFKMMDELFTYSAYNVHVLSQRKDTYMIQSYTYFPYEADNCATSVKNIKLVDECFNEKESQYDPDNIRVVEHHQDLYPKIPKKLHKCQLNVSVFIQAPYVLATNDEINRGIEILMLQQITNELDMVPVYNVLDKEVVNSLTTDDNETGIYSDILHGRSDVMVGGFFENSISRSIMSSSVPYYQDDLTWCVPNAELASNWTNVIGIFSLTTWIVTFLALFLSSLIILAYSRREEHQYHENISWSIMIGFAFTLSNAAHFFPSRINVMIFLTILMFYALHINIIYHSFLITVLTRPKFEPQIENQEMAVHAKMTFYGNEDALAHFKSKKNDRISKEIVSRFKTCKDIDKCLKLIQTKKSVAIAVSRHHSDNNPVISPMDMSCFPKTSNIYTYSVSMLTKKYYHLLPKINYVIRGISESGLLKKWQEDIESVKVETNHKSGGHGGGDVVKLRVRHVEGGFLLWALGLILACLAFGCEHLMHWWSRNDRSNRLITLIDRLFC